MNYFAHGREALDRPYVLAGTALPDWLAACDRGARLRRGTLAGARGDLAVGVRRPLRDDAWFHATEPFLEISGVLTRRLRAASGGDPNVHSAFFGHVLTEILLDATLIAEAPGRLDDYYGALDEVDPARIASDAALWTTSPPRRLVEFIGLFLRTRFLGGYLDDDGLCARLRGVARRVGVPLPDGIPGILPDARNMVAARAADLLTEPEA